MKLAGKWISTLTMASILALTGCGGSDDGDGSGTGNSASFDLSGVAIKGLMMWADIKVYDLASGDLLYSTTTDGSGEYSLSGLSTTASILKVVMTTSSETYTKCDSATGCEGGSYDFGESYSFDDADFELMALLANPGGADSSLMVTPLTHLAASRAIAESVTTADEIDAINDATAALFGLAGMDISTQVPTDLTRSVAAFASTDAVEYAAVLAGFATTAEQQGLSQAELISSITADYVANQGLVARASAETQIDLEDILAGAVDTVNLAETRLGLDIDDGAEVTLVARQQQFATSTEDERMTADTDDIEEPGEYSELEQATYKGIALLETLNDWNETLTDVGASLDESDSTLADTVDQLEASSEALEALSVQVNQGKGLALNASELLTGFAYLSMFLNDYVDEFEAVLDPQTMSYSLTLTPESLAAVAERVEADMVFPFFYGDESYDMASSGSLDVVYTIKPLLKELTSIRYSGHSSTFDIDGEESAALTLNSLYLAQQYQTADSESASSGSISFSELDLRMPAGLTMNGQLTELALTLSGYGSINGSIDDISVLADLDGADSFEGLEGGEASIEVAMDLSVQEDAEVSSMNGSLELEFTAYSNEVATGGGFQLDVELTDSNSSLSGEIYANFTDDDLQSNYAGFTGAISSSIDDSTSDYYGAEAAFTGNLQFGYPELNEAESLASVTLSSSGDLSITTVAADSVWFSGSANIVFTLPLTEEGDEILAAYDSLDLYGLLDEEGMFPTSAMFDGILTVDDLEDNHAWLDFSAVLMAELDEEQSVFPYSSAYLEVGLDVWGYDGAALEATVIRYDEGDAEVELGLNYGNREVSIEVDVEDGEIVDASRIVITDGDTLMSLVGSCLGDNEGTRLATCAESDLDFSGVISVDGVDVGTLEVRDDVPVFVFSEAGSRFEVLMTPSFLVSRQ